MHVEVTVRLSDGREVRLAPGDFVGRTTTAALAIDDPRVSEAHALVSLRRGELYLLALRRMLGVRGKPASEVRLVPGLEVELADGIGFAVVRVTTPARVVAIRAAGLGTRPLGQVNSFLVEPPLRIVARFVPAATAHVWSAGGEEWRLRIGHASPRAIAPGDRFTIAGTEVAMCRISLDEAEHEPTERSGYESRLRIVTHYDGVELHRAGQPIVTITGIGARLISELVSFGGPVSWETIAHELWRDAAVAPELRHRWDVTLGRVRTRLREAGIRGDLLHSDGGGKVQLLLYEGDRVLDQS